MLLMELSYWEKQLILYTKGHYARVDYEKDLKEFPAKAYLLGVEHTDQSNVFNFVTRLYTTLYENGHIPFTLEGFLTNIFKRVRFDKDNNSVDRMTIMKQMLADIQGMRVLGRIELGEPDEELRKKINKEVNERRNAV